MPHWTLLYTISGDTQAAQQFTQLSRQYGPLKSKQSAKQIIFRREDIIIEHLCDASKLIAIDLLQLQTNTTKLIRACTDIP